MENNYSKLEETIESHFLQIEEYTTKILLKKSKIQQLYDEIYELQLASKLEQNKLDSLEEQNQEVFLDIIHTKFSKYIY